MPTVYILDTENAFRRRIPTK